jgi:hypothetical protein
MLLCKAIHFLDDNLDILCHSEQFPARKQRIFSDKPPKHCPPFNSNSQMTQLFSEGIMRKLFCHWSSSVRQSYHRLMFNACFKSIITRYASSALNGKLIQQFLAMMPTGSINRTAFSGSSLTAYVDSNLHAICQSTRLDGDLASRSEPSMLRNLSECDWMAECSPQMKLVQKSFQEYYSFAAQMSKDILRLYPTNNPKGKRTDFQTIHSVASLSLPSSPTLAVAL